MRAGTLSVDALYDYCTILFMLVNFIETYLRLTEEEEAEFHARLRARGDRTVEATEMTWADEMM